MKTRNFIITVAALLAGLQLTIAQITTSEIKTENTGGVTTIAGNVGIGTQTPNSILSLGTPVVNRMIGLHDNPVDWYGLGINSSTLRFQVGNSNAAFKFYAGDNTEVMRIQGNGQIKSLSGGIFSSASAGGDHAFVSDHTDGVFSPWLNTSDDATAYNLIGNGNEHAGFGVALGPNIVSPIIWMYANTQRNALRVRTMNYLGDMTSGTDLLVVRSNGNVGIGTTNPTYKLQVEGSAGKTSGGTHWNAISDRRLKQDITPFTDGLEKVKQINPVWFRYNGKAGLPTENMNVGIIAQEMQEIAPYTIGKFTYKDKEESATEYLDYNPDAVMYMLINAIKEQQQQIETLKKENETLKLLSERLTAVEKQLK